jgi:1,2-diacylglycerol 3-beta-glucosyltransferase
MRRRKSKLILEILRRICLIFLGVSGVFGLYQAYISLHMFRSVKPPRPEKHKIHRFVILVCAKDEEKVIPQLLDSLSRQNYPPEAFDVFITADNCQDRTATVARAAGATVFERFDSAHKSKGYALNWFFARFLPEFAGQYDACIIFDADNLVDREFLAAMNRQLNAGRPIATGYRLGKNPTSSWIAGCSSLFWLMQTRSFHVPRARLNLPCCSVGGTGFMFDLAVLGGEGWHTRSVCEDIEFTLNSIAAGHYVAYAPDAIFYDEQPLTFVQSIKQRYRWSLGSVQVLSISTPRLFRAMRAGTPHVFDALIFSLGVVITGLSGLFWSMLVVLDAAISHNWAGLPLTVASAALGGYTTIAFFAWLMLFLEKKSWPGAWKSILTFPFYLFPWSVINIVVLFYHNTVWHDIPHTESIGIDDIEHK